MSVIPDDDLEVICRLLVGSGETEEFRSKIVRLLETDDTGDDRRETPTPDLQSRRLSGFTLN